MPLLSYLKLKCKTKLWRYLKDQRHVLYLDVQSKPLHHAFGRQAPSQAICISLPHYEAQVSALQTPPDRTRTIGWQHRIMLFVVRGGFL